MSNREAFLAEAKVAREARKADREREIAASKIQALIRGWLRRLKLEKEVKEKVDELTKSSDNVPSADSKDDQRPTALEVYNVAKSFLSFGVKNLLSGDQKSAGENLDRFERLCRIISGTLKEESPKYSYIALAINKDKNKARAFIEHLKKLLRTCCQQLNIKSNGLRLDNRRGQKISATLLSLLLFFTSTNTWQMLQNPKFSALGAGMRTLCKTLLDDLTNQGRLLQNLKSFLLFGLAKGGKPILPKTSLVAAVTLASRSVIETNDEEKPISLFLLHVLSVPGFVEQLERIAPAETLNGLLFHPEYDIAWKCLRLLASDEQQLKIHFNALEGSYALCLTANLVHLISIHSRQQQSSSNDLQLKVKDRNAEHSAAVLVLSRLLDSCGQYVIAKQSNMSHWHPVLGWFSVTLDTHLQDSMGIVKDQLARLWSPACLCYFTSPIKMLSASLPEVSPPIVSSVGSGVQDEDPPTGTKAAKQMFRNMMTKTKNSVISGTGAASASIHGGSSSSVLRLGSSEVLETSLICAMYRSSLKTLSQLKLEILAGLCHQDGKHLLSPLWNIMQHLGPHCGIKGFLDQLAINPKATAPEFQLLILFADCLSYLLSILDDVEMYEKQVPFTLGHYITISTFLNTFLFKAVWTNLIVDTNTSLFSSLHGLLTVLHRRDQRRRFTPANHWLLTKEIKPSTLVSELDKNRKSASILIQKLPHIIPHSDRVILFRRKVAADESSLGLSTDSVDNVHFGNSTLVTIHRSRIVEDGYRQLANLSTAALKGVIRVKFVNVQGLDEAGIDQDGVFKEFLEETIKKVFDPGLNLFCPTSDERLYPSPLSHMTDNHLALFEFVGKMIGKAVYEMIIIDVPFASFFVSQILGENKAAAYYSYFDELSSLDAELYRNLTYIKYYDGDAADLGLTFTQDQDVMGQIVTHELVHGGKGIMVTNDNKIAYMHAVAKFRMHTQIRDQIKAFNRGFYSIISQEWLELFTPPEVMRLIAGDNSPLDLKDLRKHTHYYGGFHDAHRVINWLWDILEKDFSSKERASFLKFVTSCSKPPLLGFQHLEPPFSIRCVEVGDDDDDGDTIGSVMRGFLALRRRDPVNRLPTASTCFNLLKLPNYQKKSTLREKLRYAVTSNTGFELS